MNISLTGSYNALKNQTDTYQKVRKEEVHKFRKANKRIAILLCGVTITCALFIALFSILHIYPAVNVFVLLTILGVCMSFSYLLFFCVGMVDLHEEISKSTCLLYGKRIKLLNAYLNDNLASATSESDFDIDEVSGILTLRFIFKNEAAHNSVLVKAGAIRTVEKEYMDTMLYEVDKNQILCYFNHPIAKGDSFSVVSQGESNNVQSIRV